MSRLILPILMFASIPALSFDINISATTPLENEKYKDSKLSNATHENLTLEAIHNLKTETLNGRNKNDLLEQIIAGVRWNDDPQRQLKNHKLDSLASFLDSCSSKVNSKIDVNWDMFYRSHCGDMQFLHSMASNKNETADITKKRMMLWAEFAYQIAVGRMPDSYPKRDDMPHEFYFKSLDYILPEDSAARLTDLMIKPNGGRKLWNARLMFSLECDRDLTFFNFNSWTSVSCEQIYLDKEEVMNMALGSLLHMIEDSYSNSHTKRQNNAITQFGFYTMQSSSKHGNADEQYSKENHGNNLNQALINVINFVLNERDFGEKNQWPKLQSILNKVFVLHPKNYKGEPNHLGYAKN
ncbi:hypothetical protein CJF42_07225 [Pseudoalteromonas sp. NBT06-2]|uniref:hypothetical protein n=1 Tax=Pseudoalteromonas sp. NBT06-2 TaxID=2025950 RepID=UPI000BA68D92|nr:hypothetical protein [Pseudoalteromonas sp. NBT06-2]PAJ74995.1 hypothetical protein CJF42_07225 [Pseudoalteromonas sp. NBT06-2]